MYKYQTEIDSMRRIGFVMPVLHQLRFPIQSYRFVYDGAPERSFLPQYIKNPQRAITDIDRQKASVEGYALSMYDTEGHSRAYYLELAKAFKKIKKAIGDSLAVVTLDLSDGEVGDIDQVDNIGHFELFEYSTCNLIPKHHIISPL